MPEIRPLLELRGFSIAELERLRAERKLPPVERWDPPHCGHSGMCIARDGSWLHEGRPILRPAMVRLFSTILRREADGRHVLVTPVEKLDIDVEATAFRAIALRSEGTGRQRRIAFELDHADPVVVGPGHALRVVDTGDGPSPRIAVRHGLEAELSRPVYYELAEIALAEGHDPPGLWSNGTYFPLDGPQ